MKYSASIDIDRPLATVVEKFQDIESMHKWQEGLIGYKFLDGTPGANGSTMSLSYQMGKRKIDMVETILNNSLPERFDVLYEANGVKNINTNTFELLAPNRTRYAIETEFEFRGFMRVIAFVMPGAFKKQTLKLLKDFKRFVESE
jgi:hypothetical protein